MLRWLAILGIVATLALGPRSDIYTTPRDAEAIEERPHAVDVETADRAQRYAVAEADTSGSPRGAEQRKLPANAGRFADPAVLVVGNTYYVYATRSGQLDIPAAASADLAHWSAPVNALPSLPAWAERGRTWAPSVVYRGDRYVMWYTVRHRESGAMCISVATATQPLGPFEDRSERPAVCQLERGGSIDPDVFINDDGSAYLVWKSEDNALGQPTSLWSAPLDETATRVGHTAHLMSRDAEWQGLIIEGPAMVRVGASYYLFYGANAWATAAAAIGYARCDTPLGPCAEASTAGPWLAGTATVLGPSGPQFFRTSTGTLMMAYHAWDLCLARGPTCRRALYIDEIAVRDGVPVLRQPLGRGETPRR